VLFSNPSPLKLPSSFSLELVGLVLDSDDAIDKIKVEFSAVKFFTGTSTHSETSITVSARSNDTRPLLLREKCKFVFIGAERFRVAYLRRFYKVLVIIWICARPCLDLLHYTKIRQNTVGNMKENVNS
jgi:hypothetical protein